MCGLPQRALSLPWIQWYSRNLPRKGRPRQPAAVQPPTQRRGACELRGLPEKPRSAVKLVVRGFVSFSAHMASVLETKRRKGSPVAILRTAGLCKAVRRAMANAVRTSAGTQACARSVEVFATGQLHGLAVLKTSLSCSARMPERPGVPPQRAGTEGSPGEALTYTRPFAVALSFKLGTASFRRLRRGGTVLAVGANLASACNVAWAQLVLDVRFSLDCHGLWRQLNANHRQSHCQT